MISDFEYLYMIRQNDEDSLSAVLSKFNRLLWKRSYELYGQHNPYGITLEDLYQEGTVGFYEALYTFKEIKDVGFAYYANLCVVSSMRTALRKCRSQSFRMLDSKWSLDIQISEDSSLFLGDIIESKDITKNPLIMSHYEEARIIEHKILASLQSMEQDIYRLQEIGYSYQEIADKYNLTPKNIDNTIQKIRRKFSHYKHTKDS